MTDGICWQEGEWKRFPLSLSLSCCVSRVRPADVRGGYASSSCGSQSSVGLFLVSLRFNNSSTRKNLGTRRHSLMNGAAPSRRRSQGDDNHIVYRHNLPAI